MRATSSSSSLVFVAIVLISATGCGGGEVVIGSDLGPPDGASSLDGASSDGAGNDDGGSDDAGSCGAVETCNGVDDDCDGTIDDAVTEACGTDVGACVSGIAACVAGAPGTCVGGIEATTEICNGIDDDCNGMTDETCPCSDGEIQPCGSDVGECAAGTQTCTTGAWGACLGETGGTSETCNGLDDNCDGVTDEGFTIGASCDGADSDLCTEGTTSCSADGSGTVCSDASDDDVEICDGVADENCDLTVDEGCTCTTGTSRPCGSDVGECAPGTQPCVAGAWGACGGTTDPIGELCNGLDDDCDGANDNGLTGTLSCGVGACAATTPACVAGMPGVCTPGASSTETCNAIDDDCNGSVDDGLAPLSCGVGACAATAPACVGGAPGTCTPGAAGVETCNGIDDDCNGSVDDGLAPLSCGVGACAATAPACVGGVPGTCTPGPVGVELCNGIDDDCDGAVDDGNPGGGVACGGADVGACIARTTCVAGAITCRGTFVSPLGAAGADGSRAAPLASISAAIANAVILGGGADVCVCDTSAAGASTFTENVTMVEGTSVLGAYDCAAWTRPGGRTTGIQNLDDDGVTFPAGITSVTALDSMSVDGFDRAGLGAMTAAITITNSSPTLNTDIVRAGDAATAIGLLVFESGLTTASPMIAGGTYTSVGVAGGTAVAVSLMGSSPSFSAVTIGGAAIGGAPAATTAYGVHCTDCAGTTFTAGSVTTSGATTTGYGFYGTGDLTGFAATTTVFGGGMTTGAMSTSFGVRLSACTGAPTWTSTRTNGGFPGAVAGSTRTAFSTTGAACAPVIDGGSHIACESGVNCYGIDCDGDSLCVLRNGATVRGTGVNLANTADVAVAMRCTTGGCASITGSTLTVGNLTRSGPTGIGLELDGASPSVDDNMITGPNGGAIAVAASRWYGVYLRATRSVLTNNVMLAGTHAQIQAVVQYDQSAIGPALIAPTLHSDTIEYSSCTTCGNRVGLVVNGPPGALGSPMGIVRNTIIRHVGVGGNTTPVAERGTQSDLQIFENNVLFDPSAMTIYLDEGTILLTLASEVNMLAGAAANQIYDCALTATWHIPLTAPNGGVGCRNTGTATGAPDHDFDANRRPQEAAYDIGADEYVP